MPSSSVCKEASPVLGLVLTGGRSRRFGRDKAGIEIDGQVLLARIVALIDSICERVFVSVRADQVDETLRKCYTLIVDQQTELGPAGGILAAHAHRPDAAWFVVACDMPFLDERSVRRLIESRRAEKGGTCFGSPSDDFPEPLCAIWEPATLERFRQRVDSGGSPSPRDMLGDTDIELIVAENARALANVNTRADFDRLKRDESGS